MESPGRVNDSSNLVHQVSPLSCLDYSILATIFVFSIYIITMILSMCGNTLALIIFLCHPEKYCANQKRFRGTHSTVARRTKNDVNVTCSEDGASSLIKPLSISTQETETLKNTDLPRGLHHVKRSFVAPNPVMTSSFNYYLASLAVSDLLMGLFCIPVTFTQICLGYWPFAHFLCPVVVYAQLVMVTASTLTNTAISLNRLTGILDPIRQRRLSSSNPFSHTWLRIACIWFVALTGSIVQLVVTGVRSEEGIEVCQEGWSGQLHNRSIYTVVLFVVLYIIPLGIQGTTYGFISYKLWKRSTPGELVHSVEKMRLKEKRRIIKMLIFIVVMFGICWLPSYIFFLLQDFSHLDQRVDANTSRVIFGVCHWIAMSNSFVNPLIYLCMSKSFKVSDW
ncbi:Neuropeptide FF receptor 2 [Fasciola gigantica]|uniref:Neuropeptide FF receptor 2 n=1 Tax=Fasciola gigantica TaxID=46835 RepID=A0A504Y864_FASGI|nr:Neuropeptide FF receptor 2 [Fasciola gigantica]